MGVYEMKDSTVMLFLCVAFGVLILPVAAVDGARNGAMCAACSVLFGLVYFVAVAIESRPVRNERK